MREKSPSAPTLVIEMRPVGALQPDSRNARLHPERHIKQLAKSIEAFGFNCPLLIDRDDRVIAGHGRLLAVKHLGWQEVPIIRLEHLTPEQVRAYAIADNRLCDVSTWDERLLGENLKELADADLNFDLDAIGFDLPEIDLLIQSLGDVSDEPDDSSNVGPEAPPVSVLGDVWRLGRHRIVCGNALEPETYRALLGTARAVMTFTDPPYNVQIDGHVSGKGTIQHREFAMASGEMSSQEFTVFLTRFLGAARMHCVDGALIYACMDWRHARELIAAGDAQQLDLKNTCVWDKGCGGMGSLYRSQHELVFVYKSGNGPHTNNVQLGRFGRNRTNVWSYPGVNSFARETGEGNLLAMHPTVKPVALVADAILDASNRGDIVLDPFLGSGTTVIAAEKTGRACMGIELDPRYVDTSIRRWQRLTGQCALHEATSEAFDALAQQRADVGPLEAPKVACIEEGT